MTGQQASTENIVKCATDIISEVRESWNYSECFAVPPSMEWPREIRDAAAVQRRAKIFKHSFFDVARQSREAIRIWAAQEAVVTGTFSQLLMVAASQLKNVHQRALLLEVAVGEHGENTQEGARQSHPWLLHLLCESLDLTPTEVVPLEPTVKFLQVLADSTADPLRALGAFGVGNELMLIPEYTAVKTCFEQCYPEAAYREFLMANIEEDTEHVRIVERLAASLMATGADPAQYIIGAEMGVGARVKYYDELVELIGIQLFPSLEQDVNERKSPSHRNERRGRPPRTTVGGGPAGLKSYGPPHRIGALGGTI
jgi:Iron-containing redox enzyme